MIETKPLTAENRSEIGIFKSNAIIVVGRNDVIATYVERRSTLSCSDYVQ